MKRKILAIAVALMVVLSLDSANAQASASIAGKTFGVEITGGDGFGFYLFVPANSGNGLQIFNEDGSTEPGTYSSYTASGATGTAAFTLPGISGNLKFVFANSLSGTNSVTVPALGSYQNGDFIMFTNPVPTSIVGQKFYISVQDDGAVFTVATSGSTYTTTAISAGGTNSYGTYSYSEPNATCGIIQLNDSVGGSETAYLVFSNSVSGDYLATQPSSGNYQFGNIALLTAQAPSSIAGNTFLAVVSSGTPPLASSGYFLFLPANSGSSYQVIGLGDVTSGSGSYSYSRNGAAGTINFSDSINGSIKGSFFYFTPLLGSYALSTGTSGQYTQTGDFATLTDPVPNSIAGQGFYITVTSGVYPYAANGSFTFSTAVSGNGYTITSISGGGLNGIGTYSYSKLNASCGGIQLTDSVAGASTAYMAFSNSISGGYVLTQPSSGGYQVGLVTALNTAIAITSPTTASNYTTASGSINLGGTASDTLGVARITWSNNRGGSGTASGTTAWIANGIGLQSGTNVISVTAYDTVSNTAQAALTVIYNPPDTTPPTISITSPTTGALYSTNVSSINLGGTAGDNVGVTQVTWSNNRGGSGTATGTTAWSVTGVALQSGTNTITVTAHDATGNTGQATLAVIYATMPPTINITSPTTLLIYTNYSGNINFGGTASDIVGIAQVTWSNNRGDNGTATGTTAWSITGVSLQTGTNVVTIAARDTAGNANQSTITVIYTLPILGFQSAGNKIVLFWLTNATGFSLQNSTTLSATSVWSAAASPVIVGNNYVVTNSISSGAMFYRLKK
ncbi:MAG TPA: Ig-like domain-containing protein [Verrucomicrobiae bacterium]